MITEICIVLIVFIIATSIILVKCLNQRCKHEWEIIDKIFVDTGGDCDYDRIYLRCKKCGDCKCKKMI